MPLKENFYLSDATILTGFGLLATTMRIFFGSHSFCPTCKDRPTLTKT